MYLWGSFLLLSSLLTLFRVRDGGGVTVYGLSVEYYGQRFWVNRECR